MAFLPGVNGGMSSTGCSRPTTPQPPYEAPSGDLTTCTREVETKWGFPNANDVAGRRTKGDPAVQTRVHSLPTTGHGQGQFVQARMGRADADIFADIRSPHTSATRYQQENVVLAAADEILAAQGLQKTPVAYLGVIVMSLQAESETTSSSLSAGTLTLLERTLSLDHLPRALLLSKAHSIASALVGVANSHSENVPVLCGALACASRLLAAAPTSAPASENSIKLFHWMLAFVVHPNPQVRSRGQQACRTALERCAALSDTAGRFADAQLTAAAARKDVQLALRVLGFLKTTLGFFGPAPLANVVQTIMRHQPSSGHSPLSRASAKVLISLCTLPTPIPSAILASIMERPLRPSAATSSSSANGSLAPDPGALRAAAAAAAALYEVDPDACHIRLPSLCAAWVRGLLRLQNEATNFGDSDDGDDDDADEDSFVPSELQELVAGCVRPSMDAAKVKALAATFIDVLGPQYVAQRKVVLETCAMLFSSLGTAASPVCDQLLQTMAALYYDPTQRHGIGGARMALLSSLGPAAKAIGPERFVALLPIKVSTDGGEDTSWLLSALRGNVGNATLAFFGSYFLPLSQWLEARATQMREDEREIEARNLTNLYEQVWALLPGFCACARDVTEALPTIARALGGTLAERPEVRGHVLQSLSLIVQTARSRKELVMPPPAPDGSVSAAVPTVTLTADATAALETVGRFGKNFLPLLFNVHQAEPPQKRPALQDAVSAVASVTPAETLGELFTALLRKYLQPPPAEVPPPSSAESGSAIAAAAAAMVEGQRGLIDLLAAVAPSLSAAQVGLLARAIRPTLLSSDVLLQKKAYKLLAVLCAHHPAWVRSELPTLQAAFAEALPACASGCKGKRLACLYAVAETLPTADLAGLLPSLLGEVVLATREVNIKTRAAAFDLLLCLAEAFERRSSGEAAKVGALRSFLLMVAGGLAGSTLHMIAAALAALGRLTYEHRGRAALEQTIVQLLSVVILLLGHGGSEVVKAALTFTKVALVCLPAEAVRPLLPSLVPAMLLYGVESHPHLRMQVRYVMERLVKRFGHDETMAVTPETHQRLLVHLRKQKVRSHNHAMARREEKRALRGETGLPERGRGGEAAAIAANGGGGGGGGEAEANRRERHAEYEAILDEETHEGEDEDEVDAGLSLGKSGRRSGGFAAQPISDSNLDLLSVPLRPEDASRRLASASGVGSTASGGGGKTGGAAAAAAEGTVRFDEDQGKFVVREAGDPEPASSVATGDAMDTGSAKPTKRQRRAGVDRAGDDLRAGDGGDASEDEGEGGGGASAANSAAAKAAGFALKKRTALSERFKRRVGKAGLIKKATKSQFGLIAGNQLKGKRGASGDVLRAGGSGEQPFAYMPLNPKLLGKNTQAGAQKLMRKLVEPSAKARGGLTRNARKSEVKRARKGL